jgi:omega-6 fatty acid desaturase (delta-12 desaturase)
MDGADVVREPSPGSNGLAASPQEIKRALAAYATPNAKEGVKHFVLDFVLYGLMIAGVLFLHPLWVKILCSILAGVKLANLGTLGHDAAHGNLASSRLANDIMGIALFTPCLYNYRLWQHDHHQLHHIHTNVNHQDSWVPLSKAQYDALPAWHRALHRAYRSSWGLGFGLYYLIERWMPVRFIPNKGVPKEIRASAWRHLVYLTTYAVLFVAFLAAAPFYSHTDSVTAVLLGFVVPFYLWLTIFSATVYVQHTHPRLPWFDGPVHRKAMLAQEELSTTFLFPHWLTYLMHNVYDHAAHHVNPRVPFYHLGDATRTLNQMAGARAVAEPFSFKRLGATLKACKLYDYENYRWLDFDGRPTCESQISEEQKQSIRAFGPGTMYVAQAS